MLLVGADRQRFLNQTSALYKQNAVSIVVIGHRISAGALSVKLRAFLSPE